MTTSLSSSLDVLSLSSSTRWASDSPSDEDEIVWSLSSSAILSTSPPLQSPLSETTDFVLVPRASAASSASPTADTIADEMGALSLTPATHAHARGNADPPSPSSLQRTSTQGSTTTAKKPKRVARQQTVTEQQEPPTAPPAAPRKKSKKGPGTKRRSRGSSTGSASSASSTGVAVSSPVARPSRTTTIRSAGKSGAARPSTTTGLGARAVVDDSVSETSDASTPSESSPATAGGYQEAQKYMTSYLAHPPPPGNNGSALLMLQALILELGCLPAGVAAGKFAIPQLPATLRQAKLLLKSHAFINVRDYLAVREQGQAALQSVMHSSRKSLVKEVRKGKRMPVREVKKAGLNVLLVNTRS